MTNINKVKPLPPLQCIQNFPFVDESVNAINNWQILQKYGAKIDEIINFINTTLDKSINEYIDARFNNMIINTMYEAETETLVLYLDEKN